MQWATMHGGKDESDVGTALTKNDFEMARDWFEAASFQSFLTTVRVSRRTIAGHPFTAELLWTRHLFYISRFSRGFEMNRSRVQDEH